MEKDKTSLSVKKQVKEVSKTIQSTKNLSRLQNVLEQPLKVIDSEKMEYITKNIKEINDKIYIFSKSSSQVSRKLQTLTMLFPAVATYRVLHQIAAQIERKQQAINENKVKLEKENLKLIKYREKINKDKLSDLEKERYHIEIERVQVNISNTFSYLEAALKEIGYLIESYNQIKKNKNIPDNWDELDFETEEIKGNIMSAFRNGLRDHLVSGRIGMGTCEYFEQFGITPMQAINEIVRYINNCSEKGGDDYDMMMDWLEEMGEKYKDCYKKACKRIGLDDDKLISKRFTLMLKDSNTLKND